MLKPPTSSLTTSRLVWLIDTSIYIYRAWHTKEPTLVNAQGQPINTVRGFLRWLYGFLLEAKPTQIGFAFDASQTQSFRRSLYPAYKAHRKPMPEDLKEHIQLCREFLAALGFVQCSSHQFEADDIIGTWLTQQAPPIPCHIISGDKDLMQLVRDKDTWWDYGRRPALTEGKIKKITGVWPKQIPDQLALAGDIADNIVGINGIGLTSAAKILHHFTSIEVLLLRLPELSQIKHLRYAKTLQERINEHQDQLKINKQLTKIYCAVPDIPHDLTRQAHDLHELQRLGEKLELSEEQLALWQQV
ncbi:5'-3' exonuclease [Thiofilum flexile]|uniref:5'-3' exonuclease n=1 Tax=Thiofilum flexile TaxID=125627 RepID=UPI000373C854|nr:5'-3' exonuclease H3TH domain-containing protein [Thiofilum flexile]